MKVKILLISLAVVIFLAVSAGVGYNFLLLSNQNQGKTASNISNEIFGWKFPIAKFPEFGPTNNQVAYSSIRDPGGIPEGLPVRLRIPVISVDSVIEDALITSDGRMDVPAGSRNVAWFSLGPHPGKEGSAVIGGHFGTSRGVPWVFYNLDKVKVGDKAYIENDKGETLVFQVRSIKSFDRNADATPVFTSNDGLAHLNIITCEGIWNQVNGTYPLRLVLFTDLISPNSSAANPISATVSVSFPRSLRVGSTGPDVVALQNALIQKGFLVIPTGISKGLFGALTRAAVAKYQRSVGLLSIGVFGPLTRAKLTIELANHPVLPDTGTEHIATLGDENTSVPPWTLMQGVKSLYATPIDVLITSCLLLLVSFVAFKVIRLLIKN